VIIFEGFTMIQIIAAIAASGVFVYLVYALLRPERF
jgi:K+-transporting ATPase KdpF subunit